MARAGGLTRMYPTPLRAQWVAHEDLADDITVTILIDFLDDLVPDP